MSALRAPADVIFTGGTVFTAPWATSRPAAVAVRSGRIVAVGPDAVVDALRGPRTAIVPLDGGLLTAGFTDIHVHPVTAGLVLESAHLLGIAGREPTLTAISSYAAANPTAAWVRGWGWSQEDFGDGGPTRELLDRLVPDRPAYLTRADGHAAWVNSRALEIAGIGPDSPDPDGGRLERDASGSPTGLLHEWAMGLVQPHIPPYTPADLRRGLVSGQAHLLSLGITAWQDASVGADEETAYGMLAAAGELVGRVTGALRWDGQRGLEQIVDLVERRARHAGSLFSPTAVKIMQDGVIEGSLSASVLDPYLDPATGEPTNGIGASFAEPEVLSEAVAALTARGFQLHFHSIGDRAVRETLDALEHAAALHGAFARPPVISHIQLVHPDDVGRFAALGAVASMQPFWAARDSVQETLTIPFLGPERSARQYPFRALAESGAVLAGGSDWMISSAYPLDGIHVAVNRAHLDPEAPGRRHTGPRPGPLYPENAISLSQGLTAYTRGGALANDPRPGAGLIAPGAPADLALLDRDPFAASPDQIAATRVVATYVAGHEVHRAG